MTWEGESDWDDKTLAGTTVLVPVPDLANPAQGKMFQGGVEPENKCLIPRNGHQTYLISEVELTEKTWNSLDKGMDIETHEQIWGSTAGPLCFEKKAKLYR